MRYVRILTLPVVFACALLVSCGDGEKTFPVRTYSLGERVSLGHLNYQVFETQWLTHMGDGPDQRVPKNRFFLVRMSVTNGGGAEVIVPNFTIEDDSGTVYPEMSEADGVPQYIGYLRRLKTSESATGNALFDSPPRHYKMKIQDETGEKTAYVDIPLAFSLETPDVPEMGSRDKNDKKK
jgi:hypothetical protein